METTGSSIRRLEAEKGVSARRSSVEGRSGPAGGRGKGRRGGSAARQTIHGVLLDICGLGTLILGESGIGKSESALELIERGHRLVSDDVVEIERRGAKLVGTSPELTRYHMELRGVGLIHIGDMFGPRSTLRSKELGLVIQLERVDDSEVDRLGVDEPTLSLLGQDLPLVRMPVAPGRNLAMLIEVAARNQILKSRGRHAARRLARRVDSLARRARRS
jgi:HPr kinase/phosphorylase